jgi:hypothetical protein
MVLDHPHDGASAVIERAMRSVRLKLVVLDEVDPGLAQQLDQTGGLVRAEPDARLDDGPDQRPSLDPGEPPRSRHSELWPRLFLRERLRQGHVQQPQATEGPQFEQVTRHGRDKVGQRRAEIIQRP